MDSSITYKNIIIVDKIAHHLIGNSLLLLFNMHDYIHLIIIINYFLLDNVQSILLYSPKKNIYILL